MSVPTIQYSEPGVFNAADLWYNDTAHGYGWTGLIANDNSTGAAIVNRTILQLLVTLAQGAASACPSTDYSAIILIPGHTKVPKQDGTDDTAGGAIYYFEMPGDGSNVINVNTCNWPIRFLGTANAKLVAMFVGAGSTPGDFFYVDTHSGDALGGMVFEDLTFTFPTVSEPGNVIPQKAAIHASANGVQNLRINRCNFKECPIGIWQENGAEGGISDCTFQWQNNAGIGIKFGDGDATGDSSAANDCHVSHCAISGTNAPTFCVGILIEGSVHVNVDNTFIYGTFHGILIKPGPVTHAVNALLHSFTNVSIYPNPSTSGATVQMGYAVLIQPQAGVKVTQVAQIVFTNCWFEPSAAASPTVASPGVLLDASNGAIETVRFVSCYATRWPGPGLMLMGSSTSVPTNIEILGGMFSGNYQSVSGLPQCGIYLENCANVRIIGATCIGSYNYIQNTSAGASPQQNVGIQIAGGSSNVIIDSCDVTGCATNGIAVNASASPVSNIFIRNCNATGYALGYSAAINVTTTGTNAATVQITDCAGYNDQSASLSFLLGLGSGTFHGYGASYYGPIEFYVNAGVGQTINTVKIGTVTTGSKAGSFMLQPGQIATITWSPSTMNLTVPAVGN